MPKEISKQKISYTFFEVIYPSLLTTSLNNSLMYKYKCKANSEDKK